MNGLEKNSEETKSRTLGRMGSFSFVVSHFLGGKYFGVVILNLKLNSCNFACVWIYSSYVHHAD